ncbi:hypothetical protein A0J47_017930 [Photobacterium damselae subsp. damselae]|uniref:hypothetical protein n=1 Tax=Photobacterium damselae TaxID=38293 RepID=UPI00083A89AE|nr:hypothetical protein [Photobacterium damselae]QSH58598.1 hypothetical protein A0J47_017930 [Photobacterium damselae subsp. damselae]
MMRVNRSKEMKRMQCFPCQLSGVLDLKIQNRTNKIFDEFIDLSKLSLKSYNYDVESRLFTVKATKACYWSEDKQYLLTGEEIDYSYICVNVIYCTYNEVIITIDISLPNESEYSILEINENEKIYFVIN